MMRAMRDSLSARPRVIVYVFASSLLASEEDDELVAQVEQVCAQEKVVCLETVVDRGPAKRHREQYPILGRLADVDALLVVRSPLYERTSPADRLEEVSPEGPFAWLSIAELAAAGLLPTAASPPPRRRRRQPVAQRARALRAQGLGLRQIGSALTLEGYRPPGASAAAGAAGSAGDATWTAARVARLLGLGVLQGGDGEAAAADREAP